MASWTHQDRLRQRGQGLGSEKQIPLLLPPTRLAGSALKLKHRLRQNSAMYSAIQKILGPHGSDQPVFSSQGPEALVVGVCIQLLLHGSVIATERARPRYSRSAEVIVKNLKDQKVSGRVHMPVQFNYWM